MSVQSKATGGRRTLTNFTPQAEEHVSTHKESGRASGTNFLETADKKTWSGHRKKAPKRGTLTSWRSQREGPIRSSRKCDKVRGTHFLKTVDGGKVKSSKKEISREALTSCRPEGGVQVREQKKDNHAKVTHSLKTAEEGASQGLKTYKVTEPGALTLWRPERETIQDMELSD